ncbi:unnamed protein product [Lathyrus oleraceus]|nr:LOB domain-containing protein 38-like [Pisum sativum]
MSCNGCRVLRKGCSEDCMLRDSLTWIQNPQAQGNATLFVAKFFGRATLMSSLSSVPPNQRSGLFQSLMYEAVGRTINPVNGAVGLLWTGRWRFCQLGVEQVLRGNGGALTPLPDHESTDSDRHQYHREQQVMIEKQNYNEEANKTQSEESESSTLGSRTGSEDYSYVYANSQIQTQTNQLLTLFL